MITGYGDYLSKSTTTTSILLIPKVDNPKSLGEYRPISLGTFSSKIISKVLATRLAHILPKVIDEQQSGFIKGRSIHDTIALAQEMLHDLDRKVYGGIVVFKFDMSKAYDRVEWRFLLKAMKVMGFSEKSRGLGPSTSASFSQLRKRVYLARRCG